MLLIQHQGHADYWACPKGHLEPGETPIEAADRELKEETNLAIIRFLQQDPILEEFRFLKNGRPIFKRVHYFVAEVKGDLIIQNEEIAGSHWATLPQALEMIAHPEGKATMKIVQLILENLDEFQT